MPRPPRPRRPGRPPLPAARRRRHRLTLCLTLAERDTLRRRAALARRPVGTYARDQSLRRVPSLRAVPVVNIRSVGQLGRLANNLNQLTKLAHQGRTFPALLPTLERLLAEVRTLRRLLIGLPPLDRDQGAGR